MAKTVKQNKRTTMRRVKKGLAKASKRAVKNMNQLSMKVRKIVNRAKKMKLWGGWKDVGANTRDDTNKILNRYFKKYADENKKAIFNELPETFEDRKKRILYVIDMQNDFIDELPTSPNKLTGPSVILPDGENLGNIGAFAVNNGGNNLVNGPDGLIKFLDNNIDKFYKIIFSRDLHDPDHCSFVTQGGTFPAHCVIGSYGSMFYPAVENWLKTKKDSKKIDIIFKGMHPNKDSFGAEKYTNLNADNMRQIGTRCCGSDNQEVELSCSDTFTGSYKLKPNINPLGMEMGGKTWKDIKDNFEEYKVDEVDEYYVCGLAGDFCVRDTALNLKDNTEKPVYVLHDFTRNAFVPLSVPLKTSAYSADNRYGNGLTVSHLEMNDNNEPSGKLSKIMFEKGEKGLQHYIFEFTPPSKYTILDPNSTDFTEIKELTGFNMNLAGIDGEVVNGAILFGDGNTYYHFVSDHRQIIDDYVNAGIKLLTKDPLLLTKT
jgi:nicotinamidase-related amidase